MEKDKIVGEIYTIIKNDVCSRAGTCNSDPSLCSHHRDSCNTYFKRQAKTIYELVVVPMLQQIETDDKTQKEIIDRNILNILEEVDGACDILRGIWIDTEKILRVTMKQHDI